MLQSIQTIHYEPDQTATVIPSYAWDHTERELNAYLRESESVAQDGERFLVGRRTLPGRIYVEYILTRTGSMWLRHIAVWAENSPYDYDYDVLSVRPVESW